MRGICRFFSFGFVVLAGMAIFVPITQAQDAPSLGDLARQARQQKQQKDAPTKDATANDVQNQSAPAQNAQKQGTQNKETASKDGSPDGQTKVNPSKDNASSGAQLHKASHVITNDDMPQHPVTGMKAPATAASPGDRAPDPAFGGKMSADDVKQQIQDQKEGIAALEGQIKELNDSIHFAGANCTENCAQWNENQQQKQRQVEEMRSVLESAKQGLEQMQDYARKMGYGSSVYDPE